MTRTHLDLHPVGKYLLGCCYLCWGALEMKTNQPQITLMRRLSLLDSTIEMKYNRGKEILALFPDTKSKSSAENDIPLLPFIPNQISDLWKWVYRNFPTFWQPNIKKKEKRRGEKKKNPQQLYMLWRLYISIKYMVKLSTKFNFRSFLKGILWKSEDWNILSFLTWYLKLDTYKNIRTHYPLTHYGLSSSSGSTVPPLHPPDWHRSQQPRQGKELPLLRCVATDFWRTRTY